MVWGAVSYNWKSPLIFLDDTGKRGVRALDYLEQVLEPGSRPFFRACWGMRVIGQNKRMKNGVYMLRAVYKRAHRKVLAQSSANC
jgi:hypothetical protein